MSVTQAGVYSLTLYENKGFTFLYDTEGIITLSSITSTGDTIELNSNDNFIKYSNKLPPADNNTILNDYSILFEINGLVQSNLDIIEKLQSSIYGWIPVITFMDNQIALINCPFFPKTDKFNSQVSHTWFEEIKPRVFTIDRLQNVIDGGIKGLLAFDGIDDYVQLSTAPDVTGTKNIPFYLYLTSVPSDNVSYPVFSFGDNINDRVAFYVRNGILRCQVVAAVSNGKEIDVSTLLNQILICSINKTTGVIVDITVNSTVSTSPISQGILDNNLANQIGRNGSSTYFGLGYIWSIGIDGVIIAEGQPAGNTDAAWSQSTPATVFGSPSTIDLP